MHADDVEVQRLALTAYRAATDPALWGELIRDAAQAVGATGASIFTPQLDPEGRMLMAAWGSTAAAMDPYLKHWVTEDAWALGARQKDFFHQAGEVRFGEEAITTPGLRSTRFYADFARQFDIESALRNSSIRGMNSRR